jgi:hypothetical protein
VLVEALVLDRHRGLLEDLGDARAGFGQPQLLGLDDPEALAARGVDRRDLALVGRLERVERWRRRRDRQHVAHAGEPAQRDEHREHGGGEKGLVTWAAAA